MNFWALTCFGHADVLHSLAFPDVMSPLSLQIRDM